ncbi:MAG: nickel pincer cofactor biosynthesis protein LarC [Anaerolineaceae bacterium]|nr:nickel pincer cofactor biosynthesis protein LarC [Anaerolineaceae bacterium]
MKTLFIDCGMGAAGDMLSAALLELLPDPDAFITKMNSLGIPGVEVKKEAVEKCGIQGTHFTVLVNHEEEGEDMHEHTHPHKPDLDITHLHTHEQVHPHFHVHDHAGDHPVYLHHHEDEHQHEDHHNEEAHHHHHSSMREIEQIIASLYLPEKVQCDVLAVYKLIAEAESHVHGVPVTDIHFHEVGTMDAVTDITAVCLLMNEIAPDEVVVSPVHVGSGQVKCAHGILPVPAPATLHILKDVPIYGGEIKGELCTPTGAALLKHFATRFGSMPVMKPVAAGYGMGKKDFKWANCVRVTLGETEDKRDTILELVCNVDDMTAESIGFAMERLFEAGAKDVYLQPVYMKKSRPATKICVICTAEDRDQIVRCLFRHTTTIGVREAAFNRYVLDRKIETVETPWGEVRKKISSGYGIQREKYEHDDMARIAREQGISIDEIRRTLP